MAARWREQLAVVSVGLASRPLSTPTSNSIRGSTSGSVECGEETMQKISQIKLSQHAYLTIKEQAPSIFHANSTLTTRTVCSSCRRSPEQSISAFNLRPAPRILPPIATNSTAARPSLFCATHQRHGVPDQTTAAIAEEGRGTYVGIGEERRGKSWAWASMKDTAFKRLGKRSSRLQWGRAHPYV